jgi:integrase
MKKHANKFKHAYQKKELEVTFEDAARKIESLGGPAKRFAQDLLRTGLRISEIDSVVADRVVGKGGKVRKIFGEVGKPTCSKSELRRALSKIGLRPHDLRKLFATKLAESGASPADLCKVMGWSDIKTSFVYLQSRDDERMSSFIQESLR